MTETLYSPEVFLPEWFEMPTERISLRYSKHALAACNNDKYGAIPVFETIPLGRFKLVELGVYNSEPNQLGLPTRRDVSKIVVRGRYTKDKDIVFALSPMGENWLVKTCWINLASDNHKTLRRERYAMA